VFEDQGIAAPRGGLWINAQASFGFFRVVLGFVQFLSTEFQGFLVTTISARGTIFISGACYGPEDRRRRLSTYGDHERIREGSHPGPLYNGSG